MSEKEYHDLTHLVSDSRRPSLAEDADTVEHKKRLAD